MKTTREYLTDSCGSVAPKAVSPIDRVENAFTEAMELAQQAMSMVATIAGHPGPQEGRTRDAYDRPEGIIPALADRADDTVSVIRSARAEMIRLADLLGV